MDPLTYKAPLPIEGEYPDYYQNYFRWSDFERPTLEALQYQMQDALAFWHQISEEESDFAYEAGKWSIKEMLSHITDTERVFVYRALCISRGETKELPGFDHNSYVSQSDARQRTWASVLQEYQVVKQASLEFFHSLSEEQWNRKGRTESGPISVSALAYVLPGHDAHHQEIVKSRYLVKMRKP